MHPNLTSSAMKVILLVSFDGFAAITLGSPFNIFYEITDAIPLLFISLLHGAPLSSLIRRCGWTQQEHFLTGFCCCIFDDEGVLL